MMRLLNLLRPCRKDDKNIPISDAGYVVIDCELTGLNEKKDSIVSIGAVKMTGGRIRFGDSFYKLVRPETALTSESVLIHEITPSEVSEQPGIRTVLSDFLRFCGPDFIIGFCVNIDMEFLNRQNRRLFVRSLTNPVIDILPVFEWMRKKDIFHREMSLPARYSLYDLAKVFEIPVNFVHNAMGDAFLTAQIFQRLIPVLNASGIRYTGELLRISKRTEGDGRREITLA